MKRILSIPAALFMFVLLLAACGGGSEMKPLPGSEELAKTLTDSGVFEDELEAVDPEIASLLYGLAPEDGIELQSWFSASGGTAEEFSLFFCQDDAALAAAKKTAEARLENQKRTFGDYAPNEVPKLEGAVIRSRDKVLVVCVAADPEKAAKLLAPYFPA